MYEKQPNKPTRPQRKNTHKAGLVETELKSEPEPADLVIPMPIAKFKVWWTSQFVVNKATWAELGAKEAEAYRKMHLLRLICFLMAAFTQLDNIANIAVLTQAISQNRPNFDFATEIAFDAMEQGLVILMGWAAVSGFITVRNYYKVAVGLIVGGFGLTSYAYLGTANFLPLLFYYSVLCSIVAVLLDKRLLFIATSFATLFLTGLRLENIRLGQNLVEAGLAYSLMGIVVIVLVVRIPAQTQVELLTAKNEQLEKARQRGLELQEQERSRIAHELHDTALAQLNQLRGVLSSKLAAGVTLAPGELTDLLALTEQLEASVRGTTRNLHAPELELCDLDVAVTNLAVVACDQAGLDLRLSVDEELTGKRFAKQIENTIFRIVQQGLTNTIRHAKANCVELTLAWHKAQGQLTLELADNGVGFELPVGGNLKLLKLQNHFGVAGFAERVETVAGKFKIISSPGSGTRLMATVPALPELELDRLTWHE